MSDTEPAATFTPPDAAEALARLGMPMDEAIPIGWAKGKYGPTTRRPIGEVVHLDRYGNQPFR